MIRRLAISALPGETRAAWLVDGMVTDLVIDRADHPSCLGNLYHGRVAKVDKALDAAFVEIGEARPGLLPLSEGPGRKLSEGDFLAVRVLREAAPGKGLRLTARLHNPPAQLADWLRAKRPPALLLRGADPLSRLLAADPVPDEVLCDDPALFQALRAQLTAAESPVVERLQLDLQTPALFERLGIEAEIESLLQPVVPLPAGGHLLIEPVQTLTAIDVNSAGHGAPGDAESQARAVNLEAAAAIPRQLRLRGLSGLIVVDFLQQRDAAARRAVVAALRKGLKDDPEPSRVLALSPSGLLEMTRRRGRPALHELLTVPCGLAGGGRCWDPVAQAFAALRAVLRENAAQPGRSLSLRVVPAVQAALEREAAAARQAVAERLGRAIPLVPLPAPAAADFEIVVG